MTDSSIPRGKGLDDFASLFRRALTIEFNVKCLEGSLKLTYAGDQNFLKQVVGDQVVVTGPSSLPMNVDFGIQLIDGILMLKPLVVELYLKALSQATLGSFQAIHDLLILYDRLNAKDQRTLDRYFRVMYEDMATPEAPHDRLPDIRAVMKAYRNDFVGIRYYGGTKERADRLRDGMNNMNAAIESLKIVCGQQPEARAWRESQAFTVPKVP